MRRPLRASYPEWIMSSENPLLNCRVCGYAGDGPPWGEDGLYPTYNICSCCGVEAGYEDCSSEGIHQYRANWIAAGAKWREPKFRPDQWNLELQLKGVPSGPADPAR
jgi:hypothetical protein